MLRDDVGLDGASVSSLNDLDRLLRDIDVTKTDVAWHITFMIYPMVIAHARRHGLPLAEVQGSHMPDYLRLNVDGGGQKFFSAQFGQRLAADTLEFMARNTPRWAAGLPQCYNLRERGCTPAMEIAVGMAIARSTFGDVLSRGVDIDDVAPHLAWVSTADIDLFEEVAKFRALRRMWSKMMREEFGAKETRSMRLRIACHTSGRSLVYQRAMNNVTRAAFQTLAAILGGVQSVETCTYDEPISIPTPEARELATFTQLILAHEVGAARTADPLGGSYYVESLTDEVERRAYKLLDEMEEHGFLKGIEDGWLESLMDDENYRREQEIQNGERLVIGVNAFRPEDDSDRPRRFTVSQAGVDDHIRRFVQEKDARNVDSVRSACRLSSTRRGAIATRRTRWLTPTWLAPPPARSPARNAWPAACSTTRSEPSKHPSTSPRDGCAAAQAFTDSGTLSPSPIPSARMSRSWFTSCNRWAVLMARL